MITIRPYRQDLDLAEIRHVCLATGFQGQDARPHTLLPDLVSDIFAVPYLVREPELGFVVDDGGRPVGYILGTADTPAFARWFRDVWLPQVADRYRVTSGRLGSWDRSMIGLMRDPDRMVAPEVAEYPAHLHIDLLPAYQGKGLGWQLMRTFLDALRTRGVAAVHLSMNNTNTRARDFYDRCGFHVITVPGPDPVTWLGRSTG